MSKLFSDADYQEKINAKIDEAHENGSASLEEDGENLQFADVEGDIIVEDKTDGMSEVTRISPNPDDDNDFIVTAVDVPAEFSDENPEVTTEENVEEKVVTESDNLASIEISRIPGPDGDADDIVDDLEIEVETGINDEEKSGTNTYSLKFKNYSKKRAQMFAKIFSHCADCFDEVVKSANVDEDVQVKFEDGKMKVMSVTFGTPARTFSEPEDAPDDQPNTDLTEIIDSANKLAEMADTGITKENADEVKTLAEEIINKAEAAENDEVSLMCIKSMCGKFSEEAAAVADAADETAEDEIETKVESNANPQVKQCEETGKWFIEEDPEKKLYDTQEEAEQVAARMFSDSKVFVAVMDNGDYKWHAKTGDPDSIRKFIKDNHVTEALEFQNIQDRDQFIKEANKEECEEDYTPEAKRLMAKGRDFSKSFSDPKVTVTIEDLEPASVGSLLGYENKSEEESKDEELAPKVDPNEGGTGRQFSMTAPKQSINPLLYTEIN